MELTGNIPTDREWVKTWETRETEQRDKHFEARMMAGPRKIKHRQDG